MAASLVARDDVQSKSGQLTHGQEKPGVSANLQMKGGVDGVWGNMPAPPMTWRARETGLPWR